MCVSAVEATERAANARETLFLYSSGSWSGFGMDVAPAATSA